MTKFKNKTSSEVVEAVKFDPKAKPEPASYGITKKGKQFVIATRGLSLPVEVGDYLVKDGAGFWPWSPMAFEAHYRQVKAK